MLPSFFFAGGVYCDARVGARAASVTPGRVGAKAWGVVVVCGGLGEEFRAHFGGDVDVSVVVFVEPCRWAIPVRGES